MRGLGDELLEAEPELEGSDSDDELEPEPELLPDSDSEDEPEPEPELLPDGDKPRTIFDQSDEDWIATAERGIGAHQTRKSSEGASSSMQWWREKARSDIAARLKNGAAPLPIERTGGEEVQDQTDDNGAPVGASNALQPPAPAGVSDGSASDGEASASDSSGSEEWEVQEQPGLQQPEQQWQEQDQLSDDEIEMNEEAAQAERERELQEMRSEFSDLQDLVKRMRSPVESSAGSTSGQRQRTRSVQEIESQIEASVDLSPPARSPAGKEAEVAGWLVTRRLARAEELIGKLEGVTVDDKSADIVASPFKVEHSSGAVHASSGTGTATPRTGTGSCSTVSRRRPRRTPGSTPSSRPEKRDDSERRRESATTSKKADRAGSQRRGNGRSEKARDKPSALTPRPQPNPTSSTPTRRRSAQRPGARASGRELSQGKRNSVNGTNRESRASSKVGSHDSRSKSRNRS